MATLTGPAKTSQVARFAAGASEDRQVELELPPPEPHDEPPPLDPPPDPPEPPPDEPPPDEPPLDPPEPPPDEPPPDEPPLDEPPESLFAGVDAPSLFAGAEAVESPFDSPPLFFGDDEYKSAYQPPPLRMKLPPLICRFAVDWPHFGQTSRAFSEIFWISSHWLLQFVQRYSYVGMTIAVTPIVSAKAQVKDGSSEPGKPWTSRAKRLNGFLTLACARVQQ